MPEQLANLIFEINVSNTTKRKVILGTWNIQGWRTKSHKVIDEFRKIRVDILVVSETKKKENGTEKLNGILHYWSEVKKEDRAKAGIAVLLREKCGRLVKNYEPVNKRILKIYKNVFRCEIVIFGIYVPSA